MILHLAATHPQPLKTGNAHAPTHTHTCNTFPSSWLQHVPIMSESVKTKKRKGFFLKKKRGAELKGGNHAASFSHVNAHIWCLFCTPPRLERSSAAPSVPQTVYRLMNDFSFNPLSLPTSGLFPYRMYFFLPLAESWRRAPNVAADSAAGGREPSLRLCWQGCAE